MTDICDEIMDCDDEIEQSHNRDCDKADDYNDELRLNQIK
jgi:hypothetical protein